MKGEKKPPKQIIKHSNGTHTFDGVQCIPMG